MDEATAKTVLSAYRVNRQDADDPLFAEALGEIARNPALAAWFQEEQRFDSHLVGALRDVPVPAGLEALVLLNAKSPPAAPAPFALASEKSAVNRSRLAARWLALAAFCVLAFVLGRVTLPQAGSRPASAADGTAGADRLALQAISYTGRMPALQFVCFDAREVAKWVEEKSAALHMGKLLDKPLTSMQMIGSSTAQWDDKPVMMIALQNGERMAMLYLVRASDFPVAAGGAGGIMEKDGWVSKSGRHGDHFYILTTKGTRQNLDFPMPL